MKDEEASGPKNSINLRELLRRSIKVFDHHIGCDEIKRGFLERESCNIAPHSCANAPVPFQRVTVSINSNSHCGPTNSSLLLLEPPRVQQLMPTFQLEPPTSLIP